MSDPGTTRPFSPAELDAIEDALERLTAPSDLAGDDTFVVAALPDGGDTLVRERLARYRAISRISRDVLRSYEAPAHVLERVYALARESAVVSPSPAAATDAAPARASFWKRIHAAWSIPLVATAVAAGVVAIVVVPMTQRSSERASDIVAANQPAAPVERPTSESAPEQGERGRLAMAEKLASDDDELAGARGGAVLEQPSDTPVEPQTDGSIGADMKRRDKGTATPAVDPAPRSPKDATTKPAKPKADAPSGTKSGGSGGVPGAAPPTPKSPAAETEDRKQEGDELARADALRKSGDCEAAVKLYESLRKSSAKKQRARALVGLALCAERKGDRDRAADLLTKARADDAEIDAYYDSQR